MAKQIEEREVKKMNDKTFPGWYWSHHAPGNTFVMRHYKNESHGFVFYDCSITYIGDDKEVICDRKPQKARSTTVKEKYFPISSMPNEEFPYIIKGIFTNLTI